MLRTKLLAVGALVVNIAGGSTADLAAAEQVVPAHLPAGTNLHWNGTHDMAKVCRADVGVVPLFESLPATQPAILVWQSQ